MIGGLVMIRKATKLDETFIYNFIVELEGCELDKGNFSKIYEENLNNPQVEYYVCEEDDKVIGFVSIHIQQLLHHCSLIAEIQELFVARNARNSGVGKQLFQKAVKISKERECSQLEVCCNQKRVSSHRFYEAQGMTNHHYKFSLPL